MKTHILIADDDPQFIEDLTMLLGDRYEISTCNSGEETIDIMQHLTPDALLLDIDFGPKRLDGLQVLKQVKQLDPDLPVFMVSKFQDIATVVKAMKQGADDYVGKSPNLEELDAMLSRALNGRAKRWENRYHRNYVSSIKGQFIGNSAVINDIRHQIDQVARTPSTVLITGETGTGKELVAREIHARSNRSSKPFIAISLLEIPGNLFESELFGHEKGAFTGADNKKPGCFEIANTGTLFLDEIGDIPIEIQGKLLRVLEEKVVRRVGGTRFFPFDVRVITATNQDLKELVKQNKFRKDLFFRLQIFPINIPPLRDHKEDIPALANYFLKLQATRLNRPVNRITPEALDALTNHDWPGNVRELSGEIERAIIRTANSAIQLKDLQLLNLQNSADDIKLAQLNYDKAFEQFRRDYFSQLLSQEHGNVSAVAERSGIQRPSLYKIFSALGINPENFR